MEFRKEVKPILVQYHCDDCQEYEMVPTGIILTVNPPLYPHKCPGCGATRNFKEKYPKVEYKFI